MQTALKIEYEFQFGDGTTKTFPIQLDPQSLDLIPAEGQEPPIWAELENHRCAECTIPKGSQRYCPVARNLSGIAEAFHDKFSYEIVKMRVTTEERTYSKEMALQFGLSGLFGIIMTTSGCPVLAPLRPMVRFHLPFASVLETVFRMTSMYLVAQYFRNSQGKSTDWELKGLAQIYARVSSVNNDFALRLRQAAKKDANANALVNLDCWANLVPDTKTNLAEIEPHFAALIGEHK